MTTFKTLGLVIGAATLLASQSVVARDSAATPPVAPTFTRDVAPILYEHCVECHRQGMFAPMSLMTYEEVRPWVASIKRRVERREMPPWFTDSAPGVFKNDARLSPAEIDTLVAWANAGAAKGDDKDLPKAPTFTEGWTIGQPDEIFTAQSYTVPASGTIPYMNLRIPMSVARDRYIQAIEIRPSNRSVVHHIIANAQPSGTAVVAEGGPNSINLVGITPNKPGVRYDPGTARVIPAGYDLVLSVHYTAIGVETVDQTRVGIIWAKERPQRISATSSITDTRFVIPPGNPNYEVRSSRTFENETRITALMPHMHVRGRSMKYIAHYPNGTSAVLLDVPKFDFNWQINYQLVKPIILPKGTRLEVIATFDNSPGNRYNPDPSSEVRWGDQSWEEMMIGWYYVETDAPTQ